MAARDAAGVATPEFGTVGILPLGRPTFDVPYAEERLGEMLAALAAAGAKLAGPRGLLFDAAATRAAIHELQAADIDRILILLVTFTDASMTIEIANALLEQGYAEGMAIRIAIAQAHRWAAGHAEESAPHGLRRPPP